MSVVAYETEHAGAGCLLAWTEGAGKRSREHSREHLLLPLREESVTLLRDTLLRLCGRYDLDVQAVGDFELAATEAFSNGVRHGSCPADGVIEARLLVGGETARLELQYPGAPFALHPPQLPDPLATSGRGRFLMAVLTDQVDYEFFDGLTRITLLKQWR
jgi:anti-sigma regulatory factor (Ser/Thr protein kinase)